MIKLWNKIHEGDKSMPQLAMKGKDVPEEGAENVQVFTDAVKAHYPQVGQRVFEKWTAGSMWKYDVANFEKLSTEEKVSVPHWNEGCSRKNQVLTTLRCRVAIFKIVVYVEMNLGCQQLAINLERMFC